MRNRPSPPMGKFAPPNYRHSSNSVVSTRSLCQIGRWRALRLCQRSNTTSCDRGEREGTPPPPSRSVPTVGCAHGVVRGPWSVLGGSTGFEKQVRRGAFEAIYKKRRGPPLGHPTGWMYGTVPDGRESDSTPRWLRRGRWLPARKHRRGFTATEPSTIAALCGAVPAGAPRFDSRARREEGRAGLSRSMSHMPVDACDRSNNGHAK